MWFETSGLDNFGYQSVSVDLKECTDSTLGIYIVPVLLFPMVALNDFKNH